jgi:GntR family transcriptional regulator, transcriptional repressor for pyruvate dehydrogenase complex
MKELEKEYLLPAIIRSIAGHISENNLKAGDKLPTELEIAGQLNVARSSVREALKSLQAIGILESKPGVGTVLSGKGVDPFIMTLIFGSIMGKVGLRHLGDIRIILEEGAVPLIIRNASENDLALLMKQAKELDEFRDKFDKKPKEQDNKIVAQKEISFHRNMLELSGNPVLEKFSFLLELFFYRVSSSGELFLHAQPVSIPSRERVTHSVIVQALKQKDIPKAEEAVRMHLRYWAECKRDIDISFIYKVMGPALENFK